MQKTIGLLLLGLLVFVQVQKPTEFLTLKYFDYLMMSTETKFDDRITLIEIDEATVQKYGGYPIPRYVYADLLRKSQSNRNDNIFFLIPIYMAMIKN